MKKQIKSIKTLFDKTVEEGIEVEENLSLFDILKKCEAEGKFVFHGDSHWNFVKSAFAGKPCVRMIFVLQEGEGGKVKDIDKVMQLVGDLDELFIFLDNTKMTKQKKFIYVDAVKVLTPQ